MVLNRKRILTAIAAGFAVAALADGGVAFASAASPVRSPARPAATALVSSRLDAGCGEMGKIWSGHDPVSRAVADYLGLSQAQVRSEVESGKSLADVARAQGKPVSGLKGAILAATTRWVDASSKLSAAQKADVISEVKSHLDVIVNTRCRPGMGMHPTG
jgi:hypothetical protein